MPDFFIKRDDTSPRLVGTLVDENGVKIDLTNAASVKFFMVNPGDAANKVDGSAATILAPPTDGRVEYPWTTGDTDTDGDYDGEFEVTWNDASKTTFPNFRYMEITIKADIGD